MRITSGSLRGRRLKSPGNLKIRPPLEQLKQSVFDMLAGEIEGKEVLDLFAGTGSFGLEALSRGAAKVIFVDSAFKASRLLKENIRLLQAEERTSVISAKVNKAIEMFGQQQKQFGLVFIDPPFAANLCQKTLDKLAASGLLEDKTLIIVHHHYKEPLDSFAENLTLVRKRKFGDNLVSVFLYHKKEQI